MPPALDSKMPQSPEQSAPPVISPEDLAYNEFVLRSVGGDPHTTLSVGKPGGGTFINLEANAATLDPLHVVDDPYHGIFPSAHEGAHRRQTPKISELPMTIAEVERLYGELGFASTSNVIEDCAINDGMVRGFPGLTEPASDAYRTQLEQREGILGTPEILQAAARLGRVPRFAKALSAILMDWAEYRVNHGFETPYSSRDPRSMFHPTGDAEVDRTLRRAALPVQHAINTTLQTGQEDKEATGAIGRARFKLMKEYVWPEIKRLGEADRKDEELRQAASQAMADSNSGLSDQARQEIQQAADAGAEAAAGQAGQALQDALDAFEQSLQDGSPTGKANSELSREAAKKLASELSGGDKAVEEAVKQKLKELAGEAPKTSEDNDLKEQLKEALKAAGEKGNLPLDPQALSDETKAALEEYKNALSGKQQKEIKEAAKEALEALDDAIAEALRPKDGNDGAAAPNPLSHAERRREQQAQAQEAKDRQAGAGLGKALRDLSRANATPYQRIYQDIAPKLEEVYERVRPLFVPEDDEQWRGAFPSGQRLNLKSAMQRDADPTFNDKLFDRRLEPTKLSFEFQIIIDRSGSTAGGVLEALKRAAVFVGELHTRLKIPHQLWAFDDTPDLLKNWNDDLGDPEIQKAIAETLTPGGGTDDAAAIGKAYAESEERVEKHKFILVFSDAASGAGAELRNILRRIGKEQKVILVHFGVGPGTTDQQGYYAFSYGDLPITAAGGAKSFFDVFVEQLERMIVTPWEFKGKL